MKWGVAELRKVSEVFNGKTPARSEQRDEGHPVLKIRDVDEVGRFKGRFTGFVDSTLLERNSKKRIQRGDTLILNAAHSATHVASKTFFAEADVEGAMATGEWLMIRPNLKLIDAKFLTHWINSQKVRTTLREMAKGIHLYPKDVAGLQIPIPPLEEQKRVAAVLDKADALRGWRMESLELTEHLLKSVFIHMFGDPATNPKDWETHSLEELCDRIVDCPHSTPVYSDTTTGFYCVRSSDIQNGKLDLASARYVSETVFTERVARHEPMASEVIYTREGGRLGFAAQVPRGKRICLGQRMMLFKAKEKVATNAFLANLLNSESFRRKVLNLVGGGAAPRINIKDLRTVVVYLPPFELQQRFESFSEALVEEELALEQAGIQTRRLFNSLERRAFQGELDLSRLKLDEEAETSAVTPEPPAAAIQGRYRHAGSFIAPPDIEAQMMALEYILDKADASIQWSEDYFKYRMLSQVLRPPFSFADIWNAVEHDIEEPSYEIVKDKLFEYLGEGTLEQQFDPERKEIVFHPRT